MNVFLGQAAKIFGVCLTIFGAIACPISGMILDFVNTKKWSNKTLYSLISASKYCILDISLKPETDSLGKNVVLIQ